MGGQSEKKQTETTEQSSTSTRNPYAPAQPLLDSILNRAQGMLGTADLTEGERSALSGLSNTGQAAAGYMPQVQGLIGDMLSGNSAAGQAASASMDALNPIVAGQFLDPADNPYLQSSLERAQNAARNAVTSRFSAGGRNFSPTEARAVAEGVADVTARTNLDAYNAERTRQLQAVGLLNQAGQGALGAQMQGVGLIPGLTALEQQPYRAQLEASGYERGIPTNQLGLLSNLVLPIASNFGTTEGSSQGTATTTQTQQSNPWQTAIGGAIGGLGLLSGMGWQPFASGASNPWAPVITYG